jgi:hypothetical protein
MNELVQIINDARQYYSEHEQNINFAAAAIAIMAVPAYCAAKKALKLAKTAYNKTMDCLDKLDANMTPEEKERIRLMNQHSSMFWPYDRSGGIFW